VSEDMQGWVFIGVLLVALVVGLLIHSSTR